MTQHTEHTSNKLTRKLNLSEYRQLQMEKAEKPDYLQDPLRAQDRSWANKLNVEIHAETTSETEVSLQKHKLSKCEYKCTQQDLHQN